MRDGQPSALDPRQPEALPHRLDIALGPRDDQCRGPVDGGDLHRAAEGGEDILDLGRGGPHREHRPALRERLHQPAARRHQTAGVLQREHPRHMRGNQLTDRMAHHEVRSHTPGFGQSIERHLEREQPCLREHRPVQQSRRVRRQRLRQRSRQQALEGGARLLEGPREHGEFRGQFRAHAWPLRSLAGEQHREATVHETT